MGTIHNFKQDEYSDFDRLAALFEQSQTLDDIDENFEMLKRMIQREKVDSKDAKLLTRILKRKRAIIKQRKQGG